MDLKLLLGGLALAGVGAYVFLNRPNKPNGSTSTGSTGRYCPQVVTQCADGSWAGSPCECDGRGGVTKPQMPTPAPIMDPATLYADIYGAAQTAQSFLRQLKKLG